VIAHPFHKRDPGANRERTKSPWVSGRRKHHHERTFTAFRSAQLKIVIACSPETAVTVAAIIVIPVAPPVRCSIRIPLLPAPVRPVPPPLYSPAFHAAPAGAGRGIAFGDGLLISLIPLDRALAAVRSSLVLAGGRSRLRPFGIRRLRSSCPPNGLRGRIRGAAIGRGELFR
jgi:hypothetical protein